MISAGQGKPRVLDTDRAGLDDAGYLMVVLLIGIAVSAVWMGALLPSWRQQAVREKEAELIFRGEQYARAIALYYRKNQRLPPNIDTLVSQRYIRRKYLDPMTGEEFLPLGALTPGASGAAQPQGPQGRRGGAAQGAGTGGGGPQAGSAFAGISGVRSTSNDTSIMVYQNQQSYSQFPFDYQLAMQKMGVVQGPATGGRQGVGGPRGRGPGDELEPLGPRGGRGPARGGGPGGPNRGGAGAGPAPIRPGAGQPGGVQGGRR
jgi:type II secretory pathway pseudopilin PulG